MKFCYFVALQYRFFLASREIIPEIFSKFFCNFFLVTTPPHNAAYNASSSQYAASNDHRQHSQQYKIMIFRHNFQKFDAQMTEIVQKSQFFVKISFKIHFFSTWIKSLQTVRVSIAFFDLVTKFLEKIRDSKQN